MSREQGRALLALSSIVGLTGADPESRTTWIHVAPFGEWKGHSEGSFALTAEHFEAVKAVLANKSTPVSLDYEHASIRPKGGPTPAAGYANSVEVRPDGLWARVEFTQRAAEMIRAGEYRFCSGVFDFASVDPETGEPLLCVLDTIALTNRPFIDGQTPIALSRPVALSTGVTMSEIDLKALAKLLDAIPGANTAEKVKKAVDLMSAGDAPAEAPKAEAEKADASAKPVAPVALNVDAPAVALAHKPADAAQSPLDAYPQTSVACPMCGLVGTAPMPMADAPPVADADMDAAVDDFDARMMADLGLDVGAYAAALNANYDAIKALLLGGADAVSMSRELAVKSLTAQLESVTKERNILLSRESEREQSAAAAEVEGLIKSGRLVASQKEQAVALARKSPKEFRALVGMLVQPASALTQPQAVALARAEPASEALADTAEKPINANDPKVIALTKEITRSLDAAGVKGDLARKNAIERYIRANA